MKTMTRTDHKSERGIVLMTALLFAVTILAFSVSVITSGVAANNQKRYLIAKQRALGAAESGIYDALARLNSPKRAALLAAGKLGGIIQGDVDSTRSVRYTVKFGSGAADGSDNDLDGSVDEADEADILEVQSTGHADNLQRTVRATLVARHRTPTMPGAVYVADPNASFTFNGNAFLISGYDVDLTGTATGVQVPGIGVAGPIAAILDKLSANQSDNVVGLGGNNSVHTVAAIDLGPMIDDGIRSATVQLPTGGGTAKPENAGDWGTLEAPAIVFGSGDYHISGGAAGSGLMIIDGNLKISGNFEWLGMIVVRGNVEFSGGGNTKRVVGGLVVQNDVTEISAGGDLTTSGTIDLLYSEETLAKASTVFASYSILNWREGPNPVETTP